MPWIGVDGAVSRLAEGGGGGRKRIRSRRHSAFRRRRSETARKKKRRTRRSAVLPEDATARGHRQHRNRQLCARASRAFRRVPTANRRGARSNREGIVGNVSVRCISLGYLRIYIGPQRSPSACSEVLKTPPSTTCCTCRRVASHPRCIARTVVQRTFLLFYGRLGSCRCPRAEGRSEGA